MIKNGGNLCYKLDFAAATSCRDTQASSKVGSRARVGSAYIVGGWHTVSLKLCLTLHQLHSPPGKETPAVVQTRHLLAC